jgi:hypothetical protein
MTNFFIDDREPKITYTLRARVVVNGHVGNAECELSNEMIDDLPALQLIIQSFRDHINQEMTTIKRIYPNDK